MLRVHNINRLVKPLRINNHVQSRQQGGLYSVLLFPVPGNLHCLCWLISSPITQAFFFPATPPMPDGISCQHYVCFKSVSTRFFFCAAPGGFIALSAEPLAPAGIHWGAPSLAECNSDKWNHFAAINGSACLDISVFDRNLLKAAHCRLWKITL